MKKYFWLVLVVLGLGTAAFKAKEAAAPARPDGFITTAAVEAPLVNQPEVAIRGIRIPVELARTPAEVQRGLSGRESLGVEKGMLFIFNRPDYYRFWMPNMNFPIDIIWITQNKVAGIHPNVSSEFDPANPKFYTPPAPVEYVLELSAGFAAQNNIKTGDQVIFKNIP